MPSTVYRGCGVPSNENACHIQSLVCRPTAAAPSRPRDELDRKSGAVEAGKISEQDFSYAQNSIPPAWPKIERKCRYPGSLNTFYPQPRSGIKPSNRSPGVAFIRRVVRSVSLALCMFHHHGGGPLIDSKSFTVRQKRAGVVNISRR